VGPRGERSDGLVLRVRDELLTVAVRLVRSRHWCLGDRVQVVDDEQAAGATPVPGRIYSMHKTIKADHLVIHLDRDAARRHLRSFPRGDDRRQAVRVRPEASRPIPAVVTLGDVVIDGRARNVSVEGMGLYVRGENENRANVGDYVSLLFCLPGSTQDLRLRTRVVRKDAMVHGIVYGLHFEAEASDESARHKGALLHYVSLRQDTEHPFGRSHTG
jgi:hypothetical protein